MFKRCMWIIALLITTKSYSDVDFDSLYKQASNGDITAQLRLAELYEKGKAVSQDYTLSAIWYRKAAEAGNVEAQYRLGDLYAEGKGVPQDWDKSENWFKNSAQQGLAKAQYRYAFFFYHYDRKSYLNLFGDSYRDGQYKKAFAWFEKAAKQDYPKALNFIGSMYEDGEGVELNIEKAKQYYLKAAELGHLSSQWRIGKMHQDGEGNVEWSHEKAVYWFVKAALNGHGFAAEDLGDIYFDGLEKPNWDEFVGKEITQDYTEAARWYLLALKNGNRSESVFRRLGTMYFEGLGVPVKHDLAATIFHKASVRGDYHSQYALANMYKEGKGVKKNSFKCYIWASLAIEGVKNGISIWEEKLIDFTRTQKACEIQLSALEQNAAKELATKYWDQYWHSSVSSFVIPIEL